MDEKGQAVVVYARVVEIDVRQVLAALEVAQLRIGDCRVSADIESLQLLALRVVCLFRRILTGIAQI